MLDVKQAEALQTMALTGSLTRAAELLHITPLSLCRILAEVEEEIGHPVLQPYGRTIRLTRVALRLAQKIKPSFDPDSLSPC